METNKEQVISLALDYLRFPLALVVIFVHVLNIDDVGVYVSGFNVGMISDDSIFYYIRYIINGFIRGISVPIYLFISGFVFFKRIDRYSFDIYKNKIRNRIHSLLVPYLIWNLLELLLVFFIHFTSLKTYSASNVNLNLSLQNILSCFWIYNGHLVESGVAAVQNNSLFPLNTPLWFIRNLFCITLVTPILYVILKRIGCCVMLGFLGVWILSLLSSFPLLNQFFSVLFFFSIGAYIAIHKVDVVVLFNRFFRISVWIYIGGSILSIVINNYIISDIFKRISILGVLIMLYNWALRRVQLKNYKKSTFLSSSSMFLYLVHALICMRLYKIMLLIIKPNDNIGIVCCLFITYAVVIIVLLLLYYIMRKYTPRFTMILTGRK